MRDANSEAAALRVLDDFMAALNRRDETGLNAAFNFPHIRIASGRVAVFEKRGDYTLDSFLRRSGPDWDHSAWDYRKVIHASAEKVHLDVRFSRYSADGRRIGSYPSLWIVTRQDGHWGVQARSSFAV